MRAHSLQIRTPEGIVFSQLLASPVTRFLAWLVDLLCISTVITTFGFLLVPLQLISVDLASGVATLSYFAISIGYGVCFEWWWRGQTIGKKLLRLRVVDAEALRLQFSQIALRNLLRFVDSLPLFYLVGGLVCWFSSKSQRLGDIAANTVVVRFPRVSEPDLDQLLAGKYNSLRNYPHLCARLRQRVSPIEASVVLQSLLRRDDLDLADRIQLFADLAAYFREKVEFPLEATTGIADEQYLRNVTDVLFRAQDARHTQGPKPAGQVAA
ncbi:MAG TPA: RDD family protein [Verrucomicrobiae bacterium]|jgi:uncharacterized RDD family membrane protein YckC|nr:RDD family protein [Verrucomicrobiae bacterium]